MPVAMLVDNPDGSQEIYDKVRELLGLEDNPAGGILHVAGPSPNGGWRVIEVWESEEDARRFLEGAPEAGVRRRGVRRQSRAGALAGAQLHDLSARRRG